MCRFVVEVDEGREERCSSTQLRPIDNHDNPVLSPRRAELGNELTPARGIEAFCLRPTDRRSFLAFSFEWANEKMANMSAELSLVDKSELEPNTPTASSQPNKSDTLPNLPPGWWVKNAGGSFAGPPVQEEIQTNDNKVDDNDDDEPSTGDNDMYDPNELDINPDSEGWEDKSPDVEAVTMQCLLCHRRFAATAEMLNHCTLVHDFDFVKVVDESGLDYYATIRYINLIRRNVQQGVEEPTIVASSYTLTQGEELLKPTLEDDALLYMIEDVIQFDGP
jgi:hypothetical protein